MSPNISPPLSVLTGNYLVLANSLPLRLPGFHLIDVALKNGGSIWMTAFFGVEINRHVAVKHFPFRLLAFVSGGFNPLGGKKYIVVTKF